MKTKESKEERNIRVIKTIWENFYNQGDEKAFLDNVSENYVWRSNTLIPDPGQIVGKAAALERIRQISQMLPGLFGQLETVVASGDTVTVIVSTRALRAIGFMGLPAIDRPLQFRQCGFHVMTEDGKLLEQTFFYDRAFILGQLGVLPRISLFGDPESERRRWPLFLRRLHPQDDGSEHAASSRQTPDLGTMLKKIVGFPAQVLLRSLETAPGRRER